MKPATWIAVDVSMPWNPSVRALGRSVGCETADGWVVRVMGWLKQHARDGQVAGYAADIADAIRWPYDLPLDVAFADAGLLDKAGRLVGWAELNGWLVERAEKDRKRHRKPVKNLDQHGASGRSDGRTVGRAETPRAFHGASAEDRGRRKAK
jgi:hypothetical protein